MPNLNKSSKKGRIMQQYRPYIDKQVKKKLNTEHFTTDQPNPQSNFKSSNAVKPNIVNRHQKSDNSLSNLSDSSLKLNKNPYQAGPPPLPPPKKHALHRGGKQFIQNNYFINYFPNSYVQNSDIYPLNQSQSHQLQLQTQLFNSNGQNLP